MKLNDIYEKYRSKRVRRGSDKGTTHSYIGVYEEILSKYVGKAANLLEIGVASGFSLLMWEEYLQNGTVHGIDLIPMPKVLDGHLSISYHCMNAYDAGNLAEEMSDLSFDIFIDDGSHKLNDQLIAMCVLWPKVKPGGVLVVEDVFPASNVEIFSKCFGKVDVFDFRGLGGPYDDVLVVLNKPLHDR